MSSKFYEHYVHNTVGLYDTTSLTYTWITRAMRPTATRVTRNTMLIVFHRFHTDCTFRCHIADIGNAVCTTDDKYAYLYIPAPLNLWSSSLVIARTLQAVDDSYQQLSSYTYTAASVPLPPTHLCSMLNLHLLCSLQTVGDCSRIQDWPRWA